MLIALEKYVAVTKNRSFGNVLLGKLRENRYKYCNWFSWQLATGFFPLNPSAEMGIVGNPNYPMEVYLEVGAYIENHF